MYGAALPPGANRDHRSRPNPVGRIIVNCEIDGHAISQAKNRLKTRPEDVLYKGTALGGPLTGEQFKCYNYEPVGVLRRPALMGDPQRFPNSKNMSRSSGAQNVRVPVVFNANGLLGNSPAEIDRQWALMGLSNDSQRYSNMKHLNAQCGGVCPATSTVAYIMAGDLLYAHTPSPEQADHLKAISADVANTKGRDGRVPFVISPLRPNEVSVLDKRAVLTALQRIYNYDKGNSTYTPKQPNKKARDGENVLFIDREFDRMIETLVENLTADFRLIETLRGLRTGAVPATPLTDEPEARTLAIFFLLASGPSHNFKLNGKDNGFLPDDWDVRLGELRKVNAIKELLFKGDPVHQFIRANLHFVSEVLGKMVGKATLNASPGQDYDLIIGRNNR